MLNIRDNIVIRKSPLPQNFICTLFEFEFIFYLIILFNYYKFHIYKIHLIVNYL